MDPLKNSVQYLKGVGEFRARMLRKLDISTIEDLLFHIPRDYINRHACQSIRDLKVGERCSLIGEIHSVQKRMDRQGRKQLHLIVTDGKAFIDCVWFRFGAWFLAQFKEGETIWLSGVVTEFMGKMQLVHPDFEILSNPNKNSFWLDKTFLPVYPLTEKISMNLMRDLVYNAYRLYGKYLEETLPDYLVQKYNFPHRKDAVHDIHFSADLHAIQAAKKRFIFEELFYHQLMLARTKKRHHIEKEGNKFCLKKTYTTALKESLPFALTSAQKRVIREIVTDMTSKRQMNRLLQGDVGSGKTIVTVFAMLIAIENGFQAVMMAPTEILAEQHFKNISNLLGNQPEISIVLITGGENKAKKAAKQAIADGKINIVIGTHALIQKDMRYQNVGFVAIDEQHRFGVKQRAFLSSSGKHPDVLHLSATPIPRSLALTVYGDLDVSVIDELPPNRKPVITKWIGAGKREGLYKKLRQDIAKGRQVYIVCPLVEESEKSDLLAAQTLFETLSTDIYKDYNCALLHGKMKQKEKDAIMRDFNDNRVSVLIATTVIEVGIDVPNASIMVIEHAERFGLSQLHQLRGRVGRGATQSYCHLIAYPPMSKEAKERLNIMIETNNGFKIAEKDMDLRGPGNFFGTEQSGFPIFKLAKIVRDLQILNEARYWAFSIISEDFELEQEKNKVLHQTYFTSYHSQEKLFDY